MKEGEVEGVVEVKVGENGGVGDILRVLVVDDSPVDRKVVEMLLKRSGCIFEVISVDSGNKAIEVLGFRGGKCLVNERKIDIILTDYFMPGMTGYDLLKTVKECNCTKTIPVIIMSSENVPHRISRCRAAGAEDFILKPLRTQDIQRLRTYVRTVAPTSKSGTKRKLPVESVAENSDSQRERRHHLAGVTVA